MAKATSHSLTLLALGGLVLLLLIPSYALYRFDTWIDWRISACGALLISLCTFYIYRRDKRRAELGAQRTPESTLHLLELFGGWPGAFLAQRVYHHKSSKVSYQMVFWLTVTLHELVTLDYLISWKISHAAIRLMSAAIIP